MARKALSKSLRFEVFKRDSFTCQYLEYLLNKDEGDLVGYKENY